MRAGGVRQDQPAADWARGGRWRAAWLSLDQGDNDPARFWRHVVAVGRVQSEVAEGVGENSRRIAIRHAVLPTPALDTQSELGAVDSPYRLLMNVAGFMGVGVSILAFSAAYHLLLRQSLAKTLAAGLLVIAGVSMVVVGFFPCDAGCVDVTRTSQLHSIFSMPGAIGLPVAAMISALVFRRDGRFSTAWQVISFWLGLVSLASGPIIAAELLEEFNGLLQRAAMWGPWSG